MSINDPHHWLSFVPETLKASPLYTELWGHLSSDEELLPLLNLIPEDQPNPITFFTTVNSLILAEPEHPFALYYPYMHPDATPDFTFAYRLFHGFVNEHLEALHTLLPTARLQTNEVTRCCNLLPAFFIAYLRGGSKPNMIEIGSSVGLNLLWDDYRYTYARGLTTNNINVGASTSPVQVKCDLRGPYLPPLPEAALPRVAHCQGIELRPRNLRSDTDMRWVRAAIWPEETERHAVLDAAIAFARIWNPSVSRGGCVSFPSFHACRRGR